MIVGVVKVLWLLIVGVVRIWLEIFFVVELVSVVVMVIVLWGFKLVSERWILLVVLCDVVVLMVGIFFLLSMYCGVLSLSGRKVVFW